MLHREVRQAVISSIEMDGENLSDERIFRQMVHDLVSRVSLDELKKIFGMKKLDPREPGPNVLFSEEERIRREILEQLRQQQVVQFEVSIVIRD